MSHFSLGSTYEEQFRLYLLGEAGWPRNARLAVQVSTDELVDFVVDPVALKIGPVHRYKFYIPGILFALFVGATVPREDDGRASLNSPLGRFMWRCPFKDDSVYRGFETVAREALRNPRTLRPGGRRAS